MNIPLPNRGVRPSTKKHNCDYQILADWVEASVLFSGYRFSKTEVADVLIEQGVYSDQDFAADFTDRLWTKFRRRSQLVGKSYPFQIDDSGIKIVNTWKKDIVYSFLLYLGIVPWLKDLIPGLKPANYNDQGLLFERLAERAFVYHGWHVTRTGWSSVSDGTIESLVDNVAEHLHDEALPDQIEKWFSQWGNDEGLDLVCTREFQDERGGCAAILIQVASGDNWKKKLHTPDIRTWSRVISFTVDPLKGFCMPFYLEDDDFTKQSGKAGVLLDRVRIAELTANQRESAMQDWKNDARDWLNPFVEIILGYDVK